MKVIGLIGGMSWESSAEYYRIINEKTRKSLGGLHSAKVLMLSVNHQEIDELEHQDRWPEAVEAMIDAARRLEKGRADFVLICCNAMHKVASQIKSSIAIPLIHIADATAEEVKRGGLSTVGLLGAKSVMEENFFKAPLVAAGLKVIIPSKGDREFVNSVIFNELSYGKIVEESRKRFLEIIEELKVTGAQGIILACTELPLLIRQKDTSVPLFDTLMLHASKAVDLALEDQGFKNK